ncbi:hypothetical protein SUGI_0552430 [Cryptomeria japonica]|uniref:TPD1 protein homolog 1 n=1 Tax=Cryptomeria japonica TaxID=3369 RepID=UPI002408C416|nr:TPD1 protein homolog 1 [Cryptomeria japonica]GLJ28125.1 hypothetical protein SUGI_0552430 [Cryptomeria japonica]
MARKEFSGSSICLLLLTFYISFSLGDDNEPGLADSCMCGNDDIYIVQGQEYNPGIPTFTVTIINTCLSTCKPRNIHMYCGWFASWDWVDPKDFRRISYDDCLVNYGRPMAPFDSIYFTYSNTYMYPLSVKSVEFV